jgi:hypothetical protein
MIYIIINPFPNIRIEVQLDRMVNGFIEVIIAAVKRYTSTAKPFPYSKRWFISEFKIQ